MTYPTNIVVPENKEEEEPKTISVNNYKDDSNSAVMPKRNDNSNDYRYGFGGHEKDDEVSGRGNHLSFGDYGYDPRLGRRWNSDPEDQIGISNYAAFRNNPMNVVDSNGKDPVDPRTGEEISINLYTAAVYDDYDGKVTPVLDNSLYKKAKPYTYQSRRQFNKPDGYADGGIYNKRDYNLSHLSSDAYSVLRELFPNNENIDVAYSTPDDYKWMDMARQGSYVFLDNTWDESLWLHSTTKDFNIITVAENRITQIVNLNRMSSEEQYDVNTVTTFDIKVGDIQSRQKTTCKFQIETQRFYKRTH